MIIMISSDLSKKFNAEVGKKKKNTPSLGMKFAKTGKLQVSDESSEKSNSHYSFIMTVP